MVNKKMINAAACMTATALISCVPNVSVSAVSANTSYAASGFITDDGTIVENSVQLKIETYYEGNVVITASEIIDYSALSGQLCFGEIIYSETDLAFELKEPSDSVHPAYSVKETHRDDGKTVATIFADLPDTGLPEGDLFWIYLTPVQNDSSFSCSIFGNQVNVTDRIKDADDSLPDDILNSLGWGTTAAEETTTEPAATAEPETTVNETTSASTEENTTEYVPETERPETTTVETDATTIMTESTASVTSEETIPTEETKTETVTETETETSAEEPPTEDKEEYSVFDVNRDGKVDWDDLLALLTILLHGNSAV